MKIYLQAGRLFGRSVLVMVPIALIIYQWKDGEFNVITALLLAIGLLFAYILAMEISRPYITIKEGRLTRGIFIKKSILLNDIEEWRNENGALYLCGKKKEVKFFPAKIRQRDMEKIYEILRTKEKEDETDFRKEHGI